MNNLKTLKEVIYELEDLGYTVVGDGSIYVISTISGGRIYSYSTTPEQMTDTPYIIESVVDEMNSLIANDAYLDKKLKTRMERLTW